MAIRRSSVRALSSRYLIALGVSGVFMVGSVLTVNYVIDQKLSNVKRVSVKTAPAPPQGANYLLLGSDSRAFVKNQQQQKAFGNTQDTQGQRSDTMMVIHVEPGSKKTLAVSFPRDLWVNIPGMGMNKINAAFNAGPDKVIQTLKDDFNIQINHFVEVDFQSFQGVVNAIGRVPVYFPYPARDLNTGLGVELGGCVLLDGSSALAYTRSRELEFLSLTQKQWFSADPTADIGRIARQQQFIRELAGIAVQRSLNDPITANTVVNRVLNNLTIDQNLSKSDILSLVDAFRAVNTNDTSHLEFQTLPWAPGPDQSGQSVLYVKEPDAQPLLARLRDFTSTNPNPPGLTVKPNSVKVQVVDGTGGSFNASSVLNDLVQKAGFVSGGTSSALAPVATTEVHYRPTAITQGELVLNYLSPQARLVADPSLKNADVSVVLGKDFKNIVLPSGGASASAGSSAGVPVAGPPGPSDTTAATSGTGLDPAKFGTPIPKTPPCR
jgi:polyisoprenyl-teichoic acid--peptidoglycan teichoic acid transferase